MLFNFVYFHQLRMILNNASVRIFFKILTCSIKKIKNSPLYFIEYVLCVRKNEGDEDACKDAKQLAWSICPDDWVIADYYIASFTVCLNPIPLHYILIEIVTTYVCMYVCMYVYDMM